MPLSKKHLFTEELQLMADYGHVISHPARIVMLEMLNRHGKLSYRQLRKLLPMTKAAVSNHLRTLERAQLIHFGEQEGETAVYELRRPVFEEARQIFQGLFRSKDGEGENDVGGELPKV